MENDIEMNVDDDAFSHTRSSQVEKLVEFKLRQPDYSKNENSVTFIAKVIGALPKYKDETCGVMINSQWQEVNWAFEHKTHWGFKFKNEEGKVFARPVACPGHRRRGKTVGCALCTKIEEYEDKKKHLEAKLENKEALLANEEYKACVAFLDTYNFNKRWELPVITLNDQIGLLCLSSTTFKKLYTFLSNQEAPFDINGGTWTKFVSTGNGREKTDEISVYSTKEEVILNGKKTTVEVPQSAALSQAQKARILKLIPDISKPRKQVVTSEQMERLVAAATVEEQTAILSEK